jgi:hypothetical protein
MFERIMLGIVPVQRHLWSQTLSGMTAAPSIGQIAHGSRVAQAAI